MPALNIDQRRLHTLGQLLSAGSQHDVPGMLRASLERLVTFWPAQAGALIYHAPHGDIIVLEHGALDSEAAQMISEAREVFTRRVEGSEPVIGYYALDGDRQLMELSLRSAAQTVGLLHLVVSEDDDMQREQSNLDEDVAMLLVRAMGDEADKLAMLRHAQQDLRELQLLNQIGQSLAANLDLASLLEDIKKHVPEVMGAERCSIMLLDANSNELVLETPGLRGDVQSFYIPLDRGIAGWVATYGIGQIVNDVEQDPRWFEAVSTASNFETKSILCAPMRIGERVVGVAQVLNKLNDAPFTDADLRLLTTLSAQAAIAVENARLVRSLKEERDKLLAKEAEVRAAIARDLHDGPTQSVAAISMNIEFVKKLLRAMPDRVEGELNVLSELVQKTSYDIRTLLFELRPLGLETQGLLSTLQQYVSRWRDPSGQMRLRLEAPATIPRLPIEVEGAIFIIVQEAINNARKHAQSSEVTIYLYPEENQLIASVRDRGRGFDLNAVSANYSTRGSLGLLNMRERAELIGAECYIRSSAGEGTTVELHVPLS